MSSMQFTKSAIGALDYGNPFVGPIDHTAPIMVLLSALTNAEIDARGYLKPGIPLAAGGDTPGIATVSVPGTATAGAGNVGAGVMGAATGKSGAPAETITVTLTTAGATGAFTVTGSVSGVIGTGAVASAFTSSVIDFTLADGTPDFAIGDTFTWTVTAGVSNRLFGVTIEAQKVAVDNASGTIAALTTPVKVIVATIGQVNRDMIEDNLGRGLTAAEVASFADSSIVLI